MLLRLPILSQSNRVGFGQHGIHLRVVRCGHYDFMMVMGFEFWQFMGAVVSHLNAGSDLCLWYWWLVSDTRRIKNVMKTLLANGPTSMPWADIEEARPTKF